MSKRNTVQRALTYEAVRHLHNHATADEVYRYVAQRHPHISKGTIYRNLGLLAEDGQILKIGISDGADRYDHQTHDHAHLQCTGCQRVFDLALHAWPDFSTAVDSTGFAVTGCDIVFKGLCPECNHTRKDEAQ